MKIVIPEALKRRFKKACIDHDSNMSEVVCGLVEAWLEGKISLDCESKPSSEFDSKSNNP
ncbi:hypothetical protein HC928_11010 [bacterium]|nr:hypothetical protein [bacterium]